MKELKPIEFIYYTDNFNVTSFGSDPGVEKTFHVYKATRNPDGSVVTCRIGRLDCTEQRIKSWLELKEKMDKDRMGFSLRGIFDRARRLFKTD